MIEPGKRLFTKDGRRVGNGIVVKDTGRKLFIDSRVWEVITDFGNTMNLTENEMQEFYHLDYEPVPDPYDDHSLESWMASRRKLVLGEPQ